MHSDGNSGIGFSGTPSQFEIKSTRNESKSPSPRKECVGTRVEDGEASNGQEDQNARGVIGRVVIHDSSSARTKALEQHRESMMRRRKDHVQSSRMVRSSEATSADIGTTQYTPAIRNFSAPKTTSPHRNMPSRQIRDKLETTKNDAYLGKQNSNAQLFEETIYCGQGQTQSIDISDSRSEEKHVRVAHFPPSFKKITAQKSDHQRDYKLSENEYDTTQDKDEEKQNMQPHVNISDDKSNSLLGSGLKDGRTAAGRSLQELGNMENPTYLNNVCIKKTDKYQSEDASKEITEEIEGHASFISDSDKLNLQNRDERREFLITACPKDAGVVQCYVKRNKKGRNMLFPEYSVFLKQDDKFLMSSRKRPNQRTPSYLISMRRNDHERNSNNNIGKLRSNFLGTEFQIYDSGISPKDQSRHSHHGGTFTQKQASECDSQPARSELGALLYSSDPAGSVPRKMQVCINQVDEHDRPTMTWRPAHKHEEMLSNFKCKTDRATRHLISLHNKPPTWNEHTGSFALDFNGRVTMSSVKNFQLINPEDNDKVIIQFGRVAKDEFTMDFSWPVSPLQAFAIVLSSFESKVAGD
mmetsp:Transcript_58704/g.70634  ORF Transcript_58704/g.70634 Transcript_58704/m.70634 type:complete len:583 (+) Transcript_58704:139-1887(+)